MIKVAILGGGLNSAVGKAHISALSISSIFSIEAACFSRNDKVNKSTALEFNVSEKYLYSDYSVLIESQKGKIDFIIILTPTDQHADQVILALKNGISVICEKALTTSVEKASEIQEYLENGQLSLFVIYNYLGYPMIKELRNLIINGKLGKILSIQVEMPQEGYIRTVDGKPIVPQNWRLRDYEIPTISLDLGVHLYIIIYYLTREYPLKAIAVARNIGNFKGIVDDVNVLIEYTNNLFSNMWYSKAALGYRNGLLIRVFGSKGSATWLQTSPEYIQFSDSNGNKMVLDRNSPGVQVSNSDRYNRFKGGHPAGFVEALANYYCDIADVFQNKNQKNSSNKEVFGYKESIEGLRLFNAVKESSEKKCWIDINPLS